MKVNLTVAASLIALSVAGCGQNKSHSQTQREAANQEWNAARAGVLGALAKDQYENGNFEKCRITLSEALKLNPDNANLHTLSAKLAIEQNQLELAQRELGVAQKLDTKNAEADYLSGVVYQRWQKTEQALQSYTSASDKAPTELAYVMARAEMLVALDKPADALTLLQEKVVVFEHSAELRDACGQLFVQQNRLEEGVDMLRQASILATDDESIREHLAIAYFKNKQYRESAESVTRLLKNTANQKRADLYLTLGECQLQLNKFTDARSSFETAAQLKPASVQAYNGIARAALELKDNRRADVALRKSISFDSKSSETQLLLGYLRLNEKKYPESLAAFTQASQLDPKDTVSLCMIGYVLEKSGHTDQALKQYAKALRINPNDEMASKMMASIDHAE